MSESIDLTRTEEEWIRYYLKSIDCKLSGIENILESVDQPVNIDYNVRKEIAGFRMMMIMILKHYKL